MKQTLKQGNYQHIKTLGHGLHLLKDIDSGKEEIWAANRNFGGSGLIYKNTHLEFVSSADKIGTVDIRV